MPLAKCIGTVDTKSVAEQYIHLRNFSEFVWHLLELIKLKQRNHDVALVVTHMYSQFHIQYRRVSTGIHSIVQMKFVGQGRSSYLECTNALTVCQKHEQIVISIGEIDQRFCM